MKNGWKEMAVGEILRLEYGKPLDESNRKPNGLFPVYGANGEKDRTDKFYHEKPSIIVGRKGSAGEINLTDKKFWPLDVTYFVTFDEKQHDLRFLYYLLTSLDLPKLAKGVKPGINRNEVYSQIAKVPSLPEQQRIVGVLDRTFDGIATAKANAEKNLQNTRALFEGYLHSVLTRRGNGWVDQTLEQVCIVERGSSPRPIKEYFTTKTDGVNWIKIGDTEEGGKYVYSTAQKITPEGAKQSRFVKEGDFILTNSMSFGRPYIMKTSGYIHDGWFVLRLNIAIDTDFFYYLLSSRFVQAQFSRLASGAVVKNISGDLVKQAVLPIPPLADQHLIVKELSVLSDETQRLAALYQRKLDALEALKKSLLHQAFIGKI
jgi:type I restriction enzyme S subunit